MEKRRLHHLWTKIRPVRPVYFLIIAALLTTICVFSLRQNNLNMIRLRDMVYQSDKDNGDTETALRNLREYVYAHMNTDLSSGGNAIKPPIQLKYRYERLVEQAKSAASSQSSQIYTAAQAECERQFPVGLSGSGRIPCIQQYVDSHIASVTNVPDSLYKFDFVSPRWTADLAGLTMVLAALCGLLFVLTLLVDWWIKTASRD